MTILDRHLPCRHARIRAAAGDFKRRCPVCRKTFHGTVVRAEVSEHLGREVERIEWEERS